MSDHTHNLIAKNMIVEAIPVRGLSTEQFCYEFRQKLVTGAMSVFEPDASEQRVAKVLDKWLNSPYLVEDTPEHITLNVIGWARDTSKDNSFYPFVATFVGESDELRFIRVPSDYTSLFGPGIAVFKTNTEVSSAAQRALNSSKDMPLWESVMKEDALCTYVMRVYRLVRVPIVPPAVMRKRCSDKLPA